MDLFLTQIFISQNMNSLTEVMLWIIVVFLSAICTLILSHLLQRIHWWENYVILLFKKSVQMKKQTLLHLGWVEGEKILNRALDCDQLLRMCKLKFDVVAFVRVHGLRCPKASASYSVGCRAAALCSRSLISLITWREALSVQAVRV